MEEKKNHPSLPSNYVTLAHLQERWLKQKQNQQTNQPQQKQQNEEKEQHPTQQNIQQRRDRRVAVPINVTASGSHPAKVYRRKNRNDSVTNHRAVEVAAEDRRKSEADTEIVDEKADSDSEVSESKKKKKKKWRNRKEKRGNRKPKVEGRGASEDAAAQGNEERKKTTIESELNDKTNGDSVTVEEVEQKFGVLSMNSGNGNQNGRSRRMNEGFRHHQSRRNDYGRGHFWGRYNRVQTLRSNNKVWVRKDEIET